jgi:hypothetical protein
LGVLAEPSPQQYALTPVSELLRRDVPGSMRDWYIRIGRRGVNSMRLCALAAQSCRSYSGCTFTTITLRIQPISPISVGRWVTFQL